MDEHDGDVRRRNSWSEFLRAGTVFRNLHFTEMGSEAQIGDQLFQVGSRSRIGILVF